MNQYLLTAFRLRRIALVIIGVAALVAVLSPTATFAASKADVGSAEFVTVGYGKDYGKGYGKDYSKDYGKSYGHQYYHRPSQPSCPHVYIVQKGDTLSKLARHYNTSVHALAKANGIRNPNKIFVGQRLCVPHKHAYVPPKPQPKPKESFCKSYYTVKHKDTLVSIAKRHHTTVHKIIADNNLRGPHYIYSGLQLCIR